MDLLTELENMAFNAVDEPDTDAEPENETIKRWQQLFQYTYAEATKHINQHRANLSRTNVSNEHWEIVRHEKEAKGYDREAYEYSIAPGKGIKKTLAAGLSPSHESSTFLLKLEGPLETAVSVQKAAGLASAPAVLSGTGDAGNEASFCRVDGAAKKAILDSLSTGSFQPTFIRVSKAEKALSNTSPYPTLGLESTLPQHRPTTINSTSTFLPAQGQYPVWYFFYGSLADPDVLSRLLSLSEQPGLRLASVTGGILKTWAARYKAIVDAPASASHCIHGHAYRVLIREHEEALQYYETEKYEVVRCLIKLHDKTEEVVNGLTFRFVNKSQDLI